MVDNQHRQIPGYRDLTQAEIDLIVELKGVSATLKTVVEDLQAMPELDQRCVSIAKTNLQQGMMWAVKAVAKPEGF